MVTSLIRVTLFSAAALAVGLFGFNLFFSDLGPNETWTGRFLLAGGIFIVAGLTIGYFNRRWWALAGLAGWGGTLLGLLGVIRREDVGFSLLIILVSLGASLSGGVAGSLLAAARNSGKTHQI